MAVKVEDFVEDPTDAGDDTDVFSAKAASEDGEEAEVQPAYKIYKGSKVAVSKAIGPLWQKRKDAAIKTYATFYKAWDTAYEYYNFHHANDRALSTPIGTYKRGDGSENIVYANLNAMQPAVYGQNPTITCSTTDEGDKDFCKALEALLNQCFKRPDLLNAKPKLKRAVGFGLLTNLGILKIDYTLKDDSREVALEALAKITEELAQAKTTKEAQSLYGQLEALETQVEIAKQSGPGLTNVMPHDLIVDPMAELPGGTDGNWQMERVMLGTEYLKARFMEDDPEDEESKTPVFVFKPTHKAVMDSGTDDNQLSMFEPIDDAENTDTPTEWTEDERLAYMSKYHTECWYVWDKITRRVFLFLDSDWTWPLWVWDDPLGLSRFFPYFILGFGFSTGGTISVGETAYYFDHQDQINDINKQVARIRRTVFDYFFYDSKAFANEDITGFIKALRGEATGDGLRAIGVKLPDGKKMGDVFGAVEPPSVEYEKLFNKDAIVAAVNRVTNTSDAFRGVQFKTNTNKAAVETYQDQMKVAIGSKVDAIEDVTAEIAQSLAELLVVNMDKETVEGLIGATLAAPWHNMDVATFNATYSLEIVAGSTEKPTSVYKQESAIKVAQAAGQFAQAAPGGTLTVMLKMLSNAFPQIIVTDDDWKTIGQEVQANMMKGVSTEGGGGGTGAPSQPAEAQGQQPAGGADIEALLAKAPPQLKQRIAAAAQQGANPEQIRAMLEQAASGGPQ